jgi:prolyl 4-hydroxylase
MDSSIAKSFMEAAVCGSSKLHLTNKYKNTYGLSDEKIEQLIKLCSFRSKPESIDYKQFYNAPITLKGKRIYYPFTQVYTYDNLVTEKEANELIEKVEKNLTPSTVAEKDKEDVVSPYRTSKSACLHYFHDPLYLAVDRRITEIMGLNPFCGESMQSQKYEIGQYYKEHCDFFTPLTKEYETYCTWMGQRTWTAMLYLNDVEEGGETFFKHLKLTVKPKRGTLIAWNNLYSNGIPNPKTLHEAKPPLSGPKYVITKWFRSWSLI